MQIVCVKTKDFKGIKLVEVVPKNGATVIGGKNRAGKSSLLDSIASTLGGAKLCPKAPIREGSDSAQCIVKLTGDEALKLPPCTVKRTWKRKEDGSVASALEIITDAGHKVPSPQTVLDRVVGQLGFDPERFLRMKPPEQAEVLQSLVGLDFTELEARRKKAFDERTEVNRNGKELRARFDAMIHHKDAPDKEVSVSALVAELQRLQKVNRQNQRARDELAEMQNGLKVLDRQIESAEHEIAEMEKRLQQARERAKSLLAMKAAASKDVTVKSDEVSSLHDEDEAEVQQKIADSETTNRHVRENANRRKLESELEAARAKSAQLSKAIDAIDVEKQRLQQDAKWPVSGLGYDENGVTIAGRPFEQASATEQREAAFAIVAGLNPSLRFAMIKDGSLLDDDSLSDFARIAVERGFQLFIERVGDGAECSLVISDGEVVPNGAGK